MTLHLGEKHFSSAQPESAARRIVTFVKPGDMVASGQRFGLIRFGSRLDVFLPDDYAPHVALGQRCIAGETIVGVRGGQPAQGVAQ